jgi:crossover junction endodeoxyribonuclease RusA
MMLELELPYPPSINHYWRRVGPRTLISREGRRFRQQVATILTALRLAPMTDSLDLEVDVFPPDHRRRDLDNLAKSLLDALQHAGVYADDSQIVRLSLIKNEPVSGGKTIVRLRRA